MVEAAVTMPVFLLLVFGAIEFSLLFRDNLTVANAARDGARVASAAGDDADADYRILQTLKLSSAVITPVNIERIVVYRASAPGEQPSATCRTGTPTAADGCTVYTSADFVLAANSFGCRTGSASDPDRNYCPSERPVTQAAGGHIGVWIRAKTPARTAFFGGDKHVSSAMVYRIEPRRVS
jgi:Flp pilus assembly protein TadG